MEKVTRIGIPIAIVMLLVWSSILFTPFAAAQAQEGAGQQRREERRANVAERNGTEYRNAFKFQGHGVAVEKESGEAYRSKIGFTGVLKEERGNAINIEIKRGAMGMGTGERPLKFTMDAETWNAILTNRENFLAEGAVEDNGSSYRVSLRGDKLGTTSRGIIFLLKGTFAGNGLTYDLTYLAIVTGPAVR